MPRKAAPTSDDPNELKRSKAGVYRTTDQRFEVRNSGVGWLLLDTEVADDLGQPLTRGPFPTLEHVRDAVPEARRATLKPMKGRKKRGSG